MEKQKRPLIAEYDWISIKTDSICPIDAVVCRVFTNQPTEIEVVYLQGDL